MISTEFGIHPEWNPEQMTGDAAWVKLPGSVNPSEYLFHRLLCLNFGSKFLAKRAHRLLQAAHIASDVTRVYYTAAGTIFGTTDVYESVFLIFLLVSLILSTLVLYIKFFR